MKKQAPTVLKVNYYGFDHKKVAEEFGGKLSYVNDFQVNKEDYPASVYHAAQPNRKKGHKEFFLIQTRILRPGGIIRGMELDEIKKWRKVSALHCFGCDKVIYSAQVHHNQACLCKKDTVYIDGGNHYVRVSYGDKSLYQEGSLDLLTDKFTPAKKVKRRSKDAIENKPKKLPRSQRAGTHVRRKKELDPRSKRNR